MLEFFPCPLGDQPTLHENNMNIANQIVNIYINVSSLLWGYSWFWHFLEIFHQLPKENNQHYCVHMRNCCLHVPLPKHFLMLFDLWNTVAKLSATRNEKKRGASLEVFVPSL